MTIEKLPSGNYRISKMIDKKRYRATVDHKPSKSEAEKIIDELAKDRFTVSGKKMTFTEAAQGYLDLKSNVLSPTTLKAYRSYLKNLPEEFTRMQIDKIDPILIQKLINGITPDYSSKSVYNIHGLISAVLGVYRPSLKLNTTLPPKARYEPCTPSKADVDRIKEAVRGTEYEIAFNLACYSLRRSEICALTAEDLGWDEKIGDYVMINKAYINAGDGGENWIIRPYNKTSDSNRIVFIDEDLAALIRNTEGKLYKGHPDSLRRKLHQLLKELGMEKFRFHDFRAFFVSYAHAIGIPEAYILSQGGWSSPSVMKKVYRRILEEKQSEAMIEYAKHMLK